ncbi:hypothetical protein [Pseudomonas putida]|uniref:hypothetical protein n=1 Tax=Pseudomonas putida TaxID=303 RepID=UPI003D991520
MLDLFWRLVAKLLTRPAWVSKHCTALHCTATFYRVCNVVEYQLTAKDLSDRVTP